MIVGRLQADPFVDWVSDSFSSFDVILTGTGPGWTGTITSSSGLWQFHSANNIQYPFLSSNPELPPVMLGNSGYMTFLGPLPSQFTSPDPLSIFSTASIGTAGGFMQFFDPLAPINVGSPINYGYLAELSFYGSYQNWVGSSTFSVTSIPDVNDVSTWTWQAEYQASGQSLQVVTPVPEPNTTALVALAALLGIAFKFCKSRKPDKAPVLARARSNKFRPEA